MKSQEDTPEGRVYYKLSDYNAYDGVIGHESINEIIADRLLTIPAGQLPQFHPLHENDRDRIFAGLDNALGKLWLDRCWEMIWRRWQTYENLRNQG